MFELTGEIVSRHEVYKVHPQLPVTLVMEAFNSCLFDGSAHPLNLTVGPRVVRLGQPVLDVVCFADHVEAHLPLPGGVTVARLLGKLDAPFDFAHDRIVGRDRMDPVWYRFQQVFKELPAVRLSALSTSWVTANLLVRSMSTNKFALRSLNFGDIHMEKPIG